MGLLGALNACGGEATSDADPKDEPVPGDGGAAGAGSGGSSTGGNATTGGTSTGGSATGGSSTGGSATGGTSTGGNASGGSSSDDCDEGEYDDDGEAATSCVPWSECSLGQYVKEAGNSTSDRTCAACEAGTFSAETNQVSCAAWTECAPGQHESAPASDQTDRQCAGCNSGTFSTTTNATECTTWTTCPVGTFVSNTPSATVDRVCTDCAPGTYTTSPDQSMCQLANACAAGTVQTAAGTSTTGPACDPCNAGTYCAGGTAPAVACAAGTWDNDENPATVCAPHTECIAGKYVTNTPSATADRVCADCAAGTYTTVSNRTACEPHPSCAVGTVQTAPGTSTSAPHCEACVAGSYCAGGPEPKVPCGAHGYDDDGDPITACVSKTVCVPGEYATDAGSATTDRQCMDCANGSFSTTPNASSCADWTVCADGYLEAEPGTASSDRACQFGEWMRQFGTSSVEIGYAVSVDKSGNVYVTGFTEGTLPGQTSAGGSGDAFLRKYDPTGTVVWTRQVGSNSHERAYSVSTDTSGNVYVTGYTFGVLPAQASLGSFDAFVMKYDSAGAEQWTRQFGTSAGDYGKSVSVDANGNVYVAGDTNGALSGQTNAGSTDVFVRKYDSTGAVQWTRQFGSSSFDESPTIDVDANGNVFVAGLTNGVLPGQSGAVGEFHTFVRKYDGAGAEQWTRQFGSNCFGHSASVDASGNVYVAGETSAALPGQTSVGGYDVFVRKYDGAGTEQWTKQLGSSTNDYGESIDVDASGTVYVAGYTQGALPGQTSAGNTDAFVMKLDSVGTLQWTRQFGSSGSEGGFVSVDQRGNPHVAGYTELTLPGQTSAGSYDAFVARMLE